MSIERRFDLRPLAPLGLVAVLAGCAKGEKADAPAPSSLAPVALASPGSDREPAGAAPAPVAAMPACAVEPEKVWAGSASLAAGVTETALDSGRVAFGAVLGGRPGVVVFDERGEGKVVRVGLSKALTTPLPPEQGRREILRVTPALGSGSAVIAFVDYREEGPSRRLVACGPSDANDGLLKYEGKPLIAAAEERDGEPASKTTSEPKQPPRTASGGASPASTVATPPTVPRRETISVEQARADRTGPGRPAPVLRAIDPARFAALAKRRAKLAAAAASAPQAEPPKPDAKVEPANAPETPRPRAEPVRELRDCRSLVDRGGVHGWEVGSELVGQPRADGGTDWSMVFFVQQEHGRGRVDLATLPLGKAPTRLSTFEAPAASELGSGFALAARYRGSIQAWLLDASKRPRGRPRVYAASTSLVPRLAVLGTERALLVVQSDAGRPRAARYARFASDATELPGALADLGIGAAVPSGIPSLVVVGQRRFVAVEADEAARLLLLLPTDAALSPTAAPFPVDGGVHESRMVALADGRLLLVYLRVPASGQAELVSRAVRCG